MSLNSQVLMLNKNWLAINIKSLQAAIKKVVAGLAKIVDTNDPGLTMYTWEEWIQLTPLETDEIIHGVKKNFRLPKVIVVTSYGDFKDKEIKLNRKNLLIRDNFSCQYCEKPLTYASGTIDHVIPKAQNGPNLWTNVVASCKRCNLIKRDRTPKQAGFNLKIKPAKPGFHFLATKIGKHPNEAWKPFLPKNAFIKIQD